ncbi:hypothetical protein C8F04DRAFT_1179508, partial [Mycena alexandri]
MNHYTNSQNGSAAHLSTPPATATNLCNKVPGIWFMKVGGDSPTDVDFSIAPEFAAAWGIPFPVPFSTAWEEEPKLKTIILSLPTRVLDALPTTAEILATTVADLQPRWPTALVVDFNIGRPDGVTWAPDAAVSHTIVGSSLKTYFLIQSPFGPLDLTNYIRSGINTVRFRQRPGQQATMTDYTFILYALPRELLPNRGSTSQHTGPSWKHRPSNPVAAQHLYPPIEMLHPAAQHPYPFHQYVSRPAPTEHPSLSQLAAPPSQAWNQRTPYPTVLPQNGSPQEHWNHPAVVHDPGARPNPVSLPGLGRPDFTNGLALGVTHEPFLIQVLTDRLSDRRTHRQALDRLHG